MVDKPGQISALGGIYDAMCVDTEQITAADALLAVDDLAFVGHDLSDALPDVLDDHLVCGDVLHGVETPAVDARLAELELLLTELK